MELSWSDIGLVVLRLKCKLCNFETREQKELILHHKEIHRAKTDTQDSNNSNTNEPERSETTPSSTSSSSQMCNFSSPAEPEEFSSLVQHKVEAADSPSPTSQIYLCTECNITFSSEDLCCEHMSIEHGLEEFSEDIANSKSRDEIKQLADSQQDLQRRSRRNKRRPQLMTLEGGDVVVPKKYRRDPLQIKCSMCTMAFEQEEILQIHEGCHNKNIEIVNSSDIEKLETRNVIRDNGFTCILCPSQPEEERQLFLSKRKKKEAKTSFSRWGQCATHLWEKHQIDCELYQCDKCEFKTYTKTYLTDHQNVHGIGIVTKFKCSACHKTFKSQSQLTTHENYHKQNYTNLPPPEDSRWYTTQACPICKRVLANSKILKRHILYVHEKLKPHECKLCDYKTARKYELRLHMRQHTGEKPFKCPSCSFATADHNSLRRHKFQHTLDNVYSCPHCNYKCIQHNAFKKHITKYHPEMEKNNQGFFTCNECKFTTVNTAKFEAHMRGHEHGDVYDDNEEDSDSDTFEDEDESIHHESVESSAISSSDTIKKSFEGKSRQKITVRSQSLLEEDESSNNSDCNDFYVRSIEVDSSEDDGTDTTNECGDPVAINDLETITTHSRTETKIILNPN